MAGKMLQAAADAMLVMRVDHLQGMADDNGGLGGKTAREFSDDRVFRVDVQVDQRGEVHRETCRLQGGGGHGGMAAGQRRVVVGAQGAGADRRRETVLFLEPRHLAAFLVDGDQQGNGGGMLQRGDEFFHLAGRMDIARLAL